jgi:NADP-reducing hydrogenase subunit HndB
MPKLTVDDLKKIREDTKKSMALREGGATVKITVHMGECGIAAGAREVMRALLEEIGNSGRTDIQVMNAGCLDACSHEPILVVEIHGQEPVFYQHMDKNRTKQVFDRHILMGEIQKEFAFVKEAVQE